MVIKNKKFNASMLLKKQCEGNGKALKKSLKKQVSSMHYSQIQIQKEHIRDMNNLISFIYNFAISDINQSYF